MRHLKIAAGLFAVSALTAQQPATGNQNDSRQSSTQATQDQTRQDSTTNTGQTGNQSADSDSRMRNQDMNAQKKNKAHVKGDRASRSQLASQLLREVDQARQAIADNNRDRAGKQIDQAQKTFQKLNKRSAGQAQSAQNIVPIYEELEQVSIIGPISKAKQTSQAQSDQSTSSADRSQQSANQSQSSNQTSADRQGSADRSPGSPAVQQMAAEYTVVALDTEAVKPHLEAAEAALKQGNMQQADAGLQAIQSGVTLSSVSSDLPLLRARRNLAMANQMVSQGNYQAAQAPLQEAADALNQYATTASGTQMAEINRTRDEIKEFAGSIGQNRDGAADKISGWWDRTTTWSSDQSQ